MWMRTLLFSTQPQAAYSILIRQLARLNGCCCWRGSFAHGVNRCLLMPIPPDLELFDRVREAALQAPVDQERLTRHVAGQVGREEQRGRGDVPRLAQPAQRRRLGPGG